MACRQAHALGVGPLAAAAADAHEVEPVPRAMERKSDAGLNLKTLGLTEEFDLLLGQFAPCDHVIPQKRTQCRAASRREPGRCAPSVSRYRRWRTRGKLEPRHVPELAAAQRGQDTVLISLGPDRIGVKAGQRPRRSRPGGSPPHSPRNAAPPPPSALVRHVSSFRESREAAGPGMPGGRGASPLAPRRSPRMTMRLSADIQIICDNYRLGGPVISTGNWQIYAADWHFPVNS